MNNRFAIITILIASAAMLLSGCDQTQEQYGKKVQFSASTKGAPSTKTSYSGYFRENDNSPLYQRINWEAGDVIRIYSPKGEGNLWSPNMDLEATNVITGNPYLKLVFSDYTLNTISPDPEKPWQSTAKLYNNGDNGLTWTGNTATFYGAYPVNDADKDGMDEKLIPHALDYESGGQTVQHLLMEINVPGAGENGQTGDPTLVSTMPLLAKAVVPNGNPVKLDFYPYFSAYEFNLKSKDQAMIINSLTVSAEEGYIWGRFFWDITSNTPFNYNSTSENPLNEETSRTITVSREGGWAISPTQEANITIFGLPNDLGKITLTINFTTGGVTRNATLFLYDPANPDDDSKYAVFSACKKTRIQGLALKGTSWQLTIKTDVNEWTYYTKELTSLDQINVAPVDEEKHTVKITGSIQTTPEFMASHGNKSNDELPNDVPESDPNYYARYYQVRTLNWNLAKADQFFEMSFTPTAPIGGYWQLVPEAVHSGDGSLDHFRYEVKIEGVSDFEPQEVPHGQIINRKIYVRIYPKDYDGDMNVYEIIMRAYFSPNIHFDPAYSADSELQDIHGNGQFSIWRFKLDNGVTGEYTPYTPEHYSQGRVDN